MEDGRSRSAPPLDPAIRYPPSSILVFSVRHANLSDTMILCLGTTPALARTMIFDDVVADDVNRATSVLESAAGKSINAAKVARLLGEEVVATGFLGGDTGRFIRTQLDQFGIK